MQNSHDGYNRLLRKIFDLPDLPAPNRKQKRKIESLASLLDYVQWPNRVRNLTLEQHMLQPKRTVRRGPGRNAAEISSNKNKRMVEYESGNEKEFLRRLEDSGLVSWYCEQPARIPFSENGSRTVYTPDVFVKLSDGRCIFVEIKPATKMQDDKTISRLAALIPFCRELGVGLLICDGKYASDDLLQHHVPDSFRDSVLAFLDVSPLTSCDIRNLKMENEANEKDLRALIVQYDLLYEINPIRLDLKRRKKSSRF